MVTVEVLTHAEASMTEDIGVLLKQLRSDSAEHVTSFDELRYVVENRDIRLVVALEEGHVIGMGTLYIMQKLGKRTGGVEDVVVDEKYRGQGLGSKLMEKIIQTAKDEGLKSISLTSRPSRVAGNKLYQKLGFKQKETNVYRLEL